MNSLTETTLGRAVLLAGVTGLRAALGPALVAGARRSQGREALALAAMGEMVIDKLPLVPSRSSLPLLIPRVLAGYWVAKQVAEQDGDADPSIPLVGAASAAAAALLAPALRMALHRAFRVSDPMLGALEDALALYLGSRAAGLSQDELRTLATDAVDMLRSGEFSPEQLGPVGRLQPAR